MASKKKSAKKSRSKKAAAAKSRRKRFTPVFVWPKEGEWRRHPDSNRGIADLQSAALPLGYAASRVAGRRDYHPALARGKNATVFGWNAQLERARAARIGKRQRAAMLALRTLQQAQGIHDRTRVVGHAVLKSRVRRVPVGDVFVVVRPQLGREVHRITE